jgi:hypothetical protein
MTAPASAGLQPWSLHRQWGLVALVFGAQVGLLFWLSDRTPLRPRQATAAPTLQLADQGSTELLAPGDPTLFALPRQQGFSGPAWLEVPRREFQSFHWTEAPRWLPVSLPGLGATFNGFIETNNLDSLPAPAQPEPELTLPGPGPLPLARERTEVRFAEDLARRRLVTPIKTRSWPHTDVLTNSVVQLAVSPDGRPVSFTLLPPGSGSREADQCALDQVRAARFEPVSAGGPEGSNTRITSLTWGLMIFQWHTLSLPPTSLPATGP